jgi:hypothetical protein
LETSVTWRWARGRQTPTSAGRGALQDTVTVTDKPGARSGSRTDVYKIKLQQNGTKDLQGMRKNKHMPRKEQPAHQGGAKQQPPTRSQAAPCGKQAHHYKSLWSHNMAASTGHHGKHNNTDAKTHQVHGRTTAMITRLVTTQRRVITKEATIMQQPVQTRTRLQDCPKQYKMTVDLPGHNHQASHPNGGQYPPPVRTGVTEVFQKCRATAVMSCAGENQSRGELQNAECNAKLEPPLISNLRSKGGPDQEVYLLAPQMPKHADVRATSSEREDKPRS